jgi:hypothetical protein
MFKPSQRPSMNIGIYRRALIALRRYFSTRTRTSIALKWLRIGKDFVRDAELMSPEIADDLDV